MKTVRATISSKNQLTIPAKFVRDLALNKNRQVEVRVVGKEIRLTPLPTVAEQWADIQKEAKKHMSRPLTDEELSNAVRDAHASHKKAY